MRTKKLLAIILVLLTMTMASPLVVNAADVSIMWEQISFTSNELYNDGSRLTVQGGTYGDFGVESCYVIAVLQKKSGSSWVTQKTWSKTAKSDYVVLTEYVTVSAGSYRLYTYHGVTDNGYTEATTMVSPTRIVS